MTTDYILPSSIECVAAELAYYSRKPEYAAMICDYVHNRPLDFKGTQQKATSKALQNLGMGRHAANSYSKKVLESYARFKSCRTIVTFELPMTEVKAFVAKFRYDTFPKLHSYKQILVSVQNRCIEREVTTIPCWSDDLAHDPFFAALAAPSNIWATLPTSPKPELCRLLTSKSVAASMKRYCLAKGGVWLSDTPVNGERSYS
jgi:hypothetical protein